MSLANAKAPLVNSARGKISGSIAGNANWHEDLTITEDGTAISGSPTGWEWRLVLRDGPTDNSSAVLTLTTIDNAGPSGVDTLTISQGASATTVQIRVPYTTIQGIDAGDYYATLGSKDTDSRVIAWAAGIVTITDEPAIFD